MFAEGDFVDSDRVPLLGEAVGVVARCSSLRMSIARRPVSRIAASVSELRARQASRRGGSSETEEIALAVVPTGAPSAPRGDHRTPVAKWPITSRINRPVSACLVAASGSTARRWTTTSETSRIARPWAFGSHASPSPRSPTSGARSRRTPRADASAARRRTRHRNGDSRSSPATGTRRGSDGRPPRRRSGPGTRGCCAGSRGGSPGEATDEVGRSEPDMQEETYVDVPPRAPRS
jgi:hypothetical protein